uniref:Uncharacterized protein n=1 Tax=Tanacetum cinerariifolium TaxID=118510 RepID=A0A699I457_TANCI|nr:hypothetical protein [Tanacetum cinerariifolium]
MSPSPEIKPRVLLGSSPSRGKLRRHILRLSSTRVKVSTPGLAGAGSMLKRSFMVGLKRGIGEENIDSSKCVRRLNDGSFISVDSNIGFVSIYSKTNRALHFISAMYSDYKLSRVK